MILVTPSFKIRPIPFQSVFTVNSGIALLQEVEHHARISHRSEDAITEDSWKRIIQAVVLQKGDWSVTEHEKVTIEVEVDRGITHEWVRHRLGSYTQESTRFVNYTKEGHEPRFIMPPFGDEQYKALWQEQIEAAEFAYKELVKVVGCPPQLARSVLPNALAAKMVVTYNLRVWRWFFLMRTSVETHPQFKQLTIPLLAEFKKVIPYLYDDIEPNQRQAQNQRLPK